jgi:hypothetical protein
MKEAHYKPLSNLNLPNGDPDIDVIVTDLGGPNKNFEVLRYERLGHRHNLKTRALFVAHFIRQVEDGKLSSYTLPLNASDHKEVLRRVTRHMRSLIEDEKRKINDMGLNDKERSDKRNREISRRDRVSIHHRALNSAN